MFVANAGREIATELAEGVSMCRDLDLDAHPGQLVGVAQQGDPGERKKGVGGDAGSSGSSEDQQDAAGPAAQTLRVTASVGDVLDCQRQDRAM